MKVEKRDLEQIVLEKFSRIEEYGFAKPIVNQKTWMTTIDWFYDDIALEVELDWREFTPFVLLVRLEDGSLPNGYYKSNGKTCRLHLQRVIKERGWQVDETALKQISPGARYESPENGAARFKERLEYYRRVLMSCIQQLVDEKHLVFQP